MLWSRIGRAMHIPFIFVGVFSFCFWIEFQPKPQKAVEWSQYLKQEIWVSMGTVLTTKKLQFIHYPKLNVNSWRMTFQWTNIPRKTSSTCFWHLVTCQALSWCSQCNNDILTEDHISNLFYSIPNRVSQAFSSLLQDVRATTPTYGAILILLMKMMYICSMQSSI